VLHEGALPAQRATTQGYAPLPGASVQFGRHRRYAWDAEVIEIGDAPRAGASTD
jgi:hypothetical protein